MVYEEFARALVLVMATRGPTLAFHVETQQAFRQGVASKRAAGSDARGVEQHLDTGLDEKSVSNRRSTDNESRHASVAEISEDRHPDLEKADIQPLFDPKLPPSANSDSKPNIGVVATHANDLQELRYLYPQLNLTIVHAEDVSDVRRFGHCQRIIALRDEIPTDTDELLGRLLLHRYVRLGGGVRGLKEQFSAWLDAPRSISSAPRRTAPGYGKEPYNDMEKKKQNRYPRMLG